MAITRIKNSSINNKTPKYNDVLAGLPFRPIIGTASDGGNGTSCSVAFTGNNVANGTITYTALSSPGSFTGTGTASPITVSGLTAGTAYTFQVKAGNSLGDSAYSAASNSVTPAVPASYESIATVTVGSGGATTIDFNNIPQTYTHLQLRTFARRGGTGGSTGINATFNGDTNTNYGQHYIEADGSTAAGGNNVPLSLFGIVDISGGSTTANVFAVGVADILDYTNTNKFKTVRGLTGVDTNGAGGITFRSGLWRSTSAITSMSLTVTSGFAQYSHFALYGIKVAS